MQSVLVAASIYLFLLAMFRFLGPRTMSDASPFDLIVLLILSEATQNAMVRDDHSVTNTFLVVITFLVCDVGLSILKQRSPLIAKIIEGQPQTLIDRGQLRKEQMAESRIDLDDLLEAARMEQGLEDLSQVKYAILERNGSISIIPLNPSQSAQDQQIQLSS